MCSQANLSSALQYEHQDSIPARPVRQKLQNIIKDLWASQCNYVSFTTILPVVSQSDRYLLISS